MCDYSLEHYRSRPAEKGETYVSTRFSSGSVGFIAPDNPAVAICMACDTKLKLTNIPTLLRVDLGISGEEAATFTTIEHGLYRDGVRFQNGKTASLQQLGPGVTAELIEDLMRPIPSPRQVPAHHKLKEVFPL